MYPAFLCKQQRLPFAALTNIFVGRKACQCQNSKDYRESHKQCCDSFSFESLNMTNLLLIMRESLQPPTYYLSHHEIIERPTESKKVPFERVPATLTNPNARIFACDFADEKGAKVEAMLNFIGQSPIKALEYLLTKLIFGQCSK